MEYKKHPLEDLTSKELAEIAEYEHPFSDMNMKNISTRFSKKITISRKKRSRKNAAIALIVAAAFALVGFANADRTQQLFIEYFGGYADYVQYAQTIEKSSVDQGIRMEVLTALNDGDNTYLFVDLKDETGNRLSDDMFIDKWDMEGGREIGGGNCRLMRYDPATGIATLAIHAIGGRPGKDAVFTLSSFFTDEIKFDFTADTLDLDKLLSENDGAFVHRDKSGGTGGGMSQKFMDDGHDLQDITEVLEQDMIHLEIPGYDKGYLSNIGYRNGYLHIQMNPDNEAGNEALMLHLVHKQTGVEIPIYYSIGYGKYAVSEMIYSSDYDESVFEISRDELKDYSLHLHGWYYNSVFEGNWQVGFQVPERMETIVMPANTAISLNGKECTIGTIEVSPLSVTIRFSGGPIGSEKVDVTLVYKDGTKKPLVQGLNMRFQNDDMADTLQLNGPIMNFEQLTALEINSTIIELYK